MSKDRLGGIPIALGIGIAISIRIGIAISIRIGIGIAIPVGIAIGIGIAVAIVTELKRDSESGCGSRFRNRIPFLLGRRELAERSVYAEFSPPFGRTEQRSKTSSTAPPRGPRAAA
jgi:hypothetical protein